LQRTARALSPVRDSDVFMEQVAGYCDRLPEEDRHGMAVLFDALQRDRVKGRFQLLAYLDSEAYNEFKHGFSVFMTDSAKDWNTTLRVRDLVGSMLWRRYEELRMHMTGIDLTGKIDQQVEDALHETRIAGKRLRYVLDTFREALGPQTRNSLKPLEEMQETLGAVQDIAVATAYVKDLDVDKASRPIIKAYLASREEERTRLLAELPRQWEYILGADYRHDLARLIAEL
jgi:CHAD domain-containing protein